MLLTKALRSSTYRFALISIGIFGSLVLCLFGFVYVTTTQHVRQTLDRSIAAERHVLDQAYRSGGRDQAIAVVRDQAMFAEADSTFLLFVDTKGRPIAGNLASWPQGLVGSSGSQTIGLPDGSQARVTFETMPSGDRLLVGESIEEVAFATKMRLAFLLIATFIVVLAGTASIAVTRRTVGRIESINTTTAAIMRSGLGQRIPMRGTGDEWDQLAANLNAMLDRIEVLVDEIRQVSDNVAHDLRTPLARIKCRLEHAQQKARDPEADQGLIARSLSDLDDVLRMFTSLTRISRIEATALHPAGELVNLSKVAHDVGELFDPAAEQRSGTLEVVSERAVFVDGDRDLLFDALSNLVDNAIKHGPEGGAVRVSVFEADGRAMVSVSDEGPGIPAGEREKVLKRFYRLEGSRHTPGNGLGLSLVAAVARFHDFKIEMADGMSGLVVTLSFAAPS